MFSKLYKFCGFDWELLWCNLILLALIGLTLFERRTCFSCIKNNNSFLLRKCMYIYIYVYSTIIAKIKALLSILHLLIIRIFHSGIHKNSIFILIDCVTIFKLIFSKLYNLLSPIYCFLNFPDYPFLVIKTSTSC